ncbi:hypothetical protein [Nitrosophilus labii]|uniref:hypothetical protein n=1 Tax=Nitrosophilus labii TaxID=2706014 RepID=UPI0016571069|nr:hypothetical protein [Nitrosophilus labii]
MLLFIYGILISFIYFFHLKKEIESVSLKKRKIIYTLFFRLAILAILFGILFVIYKDKAIISLISFLISRWLYLKYKLSKQPKQLS